MPLTDLPLDELREYRPEVPAPADFDAFWTDTLATARAAAGGPAVYTPVADAPLTAVDVFDVRFPGWGGQPVAGWLLLPRGARGPLPAVVQYIGYSGGRGLYTEHLLWSAAGYAHLVVDSRGQGHETPDPDPVPGPQYVRGFMTRGIQDPEHYYYRRIMTDCVRAVDALREHPAIDPSRIVVAGGSQGGGLALSTAGLAGDAVAAALVDVPFLCHYRRSAEIASAGPYPEIAEYLGFHQRHDPEAAFRTLNYFDGLHFAPRASAPALFSVALMDPVCPPSTVFAAYNRYAGEKDITVWPFGDHAGGRGSQPVEQLRWLAARGLGASAG
ncbi:MULTISPECIES: acetylxylan esterase [Streptomyces]|uniref:acetylxylan esterase n=1 Tax=Streptomyces TaxID=1883 RepID=UPI0002EF4A22|nr:MULTISPECIES: acetylxylan esterase [Streptomyces]QGA70161.1 acetyl xylan esterase [Streptomyces sp.]QKV67487.1 acetylxylan esterase [Streptomyces harbinensis]